MTDIKSMTERQLADFFKNMGQPAFRAKQVFTWLHRGVRSFDEMTDLSKPLRARLAETCFITARRQLHRDSPHAVPPRQHRVYLLSGGLPYGLRLLRQHHRRQGPGPAAI